jgi:hypothetical protein
VISTCEDQRPLSRLLFRRGFDRRCCDELQVCRPPFDASLSAPGRINCELQESSHRGPVGSSSDDGTLFADHYHASILRSPTQVANALAYVLMNHLHHFPEKGPAYRHDARDRFSSAWSHQGPIRPS